jgi:hypothetical protein
MVDLSRHEANIVDIATTQCKILSHAQAMLEYTVVVLVGRGETSKVSLGERLNSFVYAACSLEVGGTGRTYSHHNVLL